VTQLLCSNQQDLSWVIWYILQVYISRAPIDSSSLHSDAQYISQSLARIMRALFEICLRRGWSEMTSLLLEYCKAVDHKIWPHLHPLRQFDKDLSPQVCYQLPLLLMFTLFFKCNSFSLN
jgi:hypothetical protein